ncbi:MAG: Cys-tRNA(Pro) deacylase [Selenomonadaceae bacterium]|nr:Cys-tRNA(Pro) deacylase [Selenomonadaceae bacterium]
MKKVNKTNAARILDRLGIQYDLVTYEVDEEDLSAIHVAEITGMDISMIFKTLVSRGDRSGIIFAVIPGGLEVDLKLLASASGNKRVELVPLKEVLPLTGYIRGGCSPLGAKKNYPVYLDSRAMDLEKISISAGKRGEQIILKPSDLIQATQATVAEIAK